jgi:glutathione S-transferase
MKLIGSPRPALTCARCASSWLKKSWTTSSSPRTSGPPTRTIGESNPLGKVPCLVMEGGEAVFDSRVIVEYLDTLSPVGKLIPAGP